MSIPLDINGTEYQYPEVNDLEWGPDATDWAVAVTTGLLQKAGGLFLLLDDVDFGSNFGLISIYFTSRTADAAASGVLRLANTDAVSWRNFANDNDLALTVNASDQLLYNGSLVVPIATVSDTATIDLTLTAGDLSASIIPLSITDALISASAAIAYTKLALTGAIVNADINASAAIDYSKLATLTASHALQSSASGKVEVSGVLAVELGYVSGVTSAIQTQLNAKQATGNYITALTGDVTATGPGSVAGTIASNAVTNAKLAQMATLTLKGNNTGGTANALDLTVTQVNTMLGTFANPMSAAGQMIYGGASGVPSVVAAGTARQYLKSNGTTAPTFTSFTAPAVQVLGSSGTYTTPAGVLYLRVRMTGGGGGGAGSGGGATSGGNGVDSTFGTSFITCTAGNGGSNTGGAGSGGGTSVQPGADGVKVAGGGAGAGAVGVFVAGGVGGSSFFGGAGYGGLGSTGGSAAASSGSGGGGGGAGGTSVVTGGGGGAAGSVDVIIPAPLSSYAYVRGGGGTAGAAGTNGFTGGTGGPGFIEVTEYYQ